MRNNQQHSTAAAGTGYNGHWGDRGREGLRVEWLQWQSTVSGEDNGKRKRTWSMTQLAHPHPHFDVGSGSLGEWGLGDIEELVL